MGNTIEIMDTTKICRNFPIEPEQEILRESFLGTISHLFEKASIVIVEGQDEIGKTTLLAQFAKQLPRNSISVFITPATLSSYDPDSLRTNLLCQAWWILNQKELEIEELEKLDIKTQWGIKQSSLQKKARVSREKYYFIIDGLGEIPENHSNFRNLILDLLPLGHGDEFRFLISGNMEMFPKQILDQLSYKSFQMSSFTFDEAQRNLSDLEFSKENITELYKTFKLPGQLASIRRLIQSGASKEDFLENIPSKAAKLLELEWKYLDLSNEELSKALALVAFSTLELSTNSIADILCIRDEEVINILEPISFLSIKAHENIRFVSEAHQKYAQSKLYMHKDNVENQIIDHLKNSEDPKAIVYLPTIYSKSGKFGELLNFLTPEIFSQILKTNQSLIPLHETAKLGVVAAHNLHRDGDLIRLGLQSAIIDELYSSDIWESEINALIALRDIPSALTLIERAITKEDRLFLLSILANAKEKHQLDIQGIEERIKNAYQQVDHKKLGDKAIDIAANLINIDSMRDLAFDLVEKNTDSQEGEDALDWAFAKLSLKALADNDGGLSTLDVVEKIKNKIKNPKAQSFLTKSLFYLNFSSVKIIAEANKMERLSERLYLLRSWISENREAPDIAEVVSFGLNIAITSTDYAPNARDFRELSTPLPFIDDIEKRKHLINIIDGQKGNIEELGPIEDYVRIMLILARAEKEIDESSCLNRLIEAYLYTCVLEDLSTKSSCLARISSALVTIDPDKIYENKDSLHSLVNNDLDKCVDELLNKTADQYFVTKGIIRALAKNNPSSALEIAQRLNGEGRRNSATFGLARSLLDVSDDKLNLIFINTLMVKISDISMKDDLILQILARINGITQPETIDKVLLYNIVDSIKEIQDASDKCNACCFALQILQTNELNEKDKIRASIIELLKLTWDAIDVGWVKVDVGFKIVESLADFPTLSQDFFAKVEDYRNCIFLDSPGTALTYLACLRLGIRALSGLYSQNVDTEYDLLRILLAIENIPSFTERVGLYTDLALRFKLAKRLDKFNEIVITKIKPSLDKIPKIDGLARELAIIAAAPALYLSHPASAFAMIDSIKYSSNRDNAYREICSYILTKCYEEPYYDLGSRKGKKLTYDEIMDLINLLNRFDEDAKIYGLISEITDSINTHRDILTKNQKAEIARTLEEIANKRFPNDKYIKHRGYQIISLAQIYKIRNTKTLEWDDLIKQAREINVADQALILTYIAECLHNKESNKYKQLMIDAEKLIKEIPSDYDRINRYEQLSQTTIIYDRQQSQKYLKTGMDIVIKQDETDMLSAQRRYIDLAYKIDPDFAATLASMADNDPAREKTKINIQRRLSQLKLKDQISESENNSREQEFMATKDYPSAAWTLLGSLNAGRVSPIRFESVRDYAKVGSNLSISQSYPIYAWLIQNGINKYQDTSFAGDYLRPLFDATLAGCNLVLSIAQKSTTQMKIAKASIKGGPENSKVIADIDSNEAKGLLTKWLKTNIGDELYIADGYFGIEELWVLQEVKGINPNCKVYILTSKEHNKNITSPEDAYQEYWRLNISDQETPPTEIVVVSTTSSDKSPIHDRWWISGKAGIGIGTSINGLGGNRISEIRDLSVAESEEREEIIKRFVHYKIREYKGNRIRYLSFTMP